MRVPSPRQGRYASSSGLVSLHDTSSFTYDSFLDKIAAENTEKETDPLLWEQESWLTRWKTDVALIAFAAIRITAAPGLHARARAYVEVRACPAKVNAHARECAVRIAVYTLGSASRAELSSDDCSKQDGSLLLETRKCLYISANFAWILAEFFEFFFIAIYFY